MTTTRQPKRSQIPVALTEVSSLFLAGTISKTIVAPLERVKLILQNQPLIHMPEKYKYKGVIDALRRIPVDQGFFSFWRGNGTNVFRTIPNSFIRFSSYEGFNRIFLPKGDFQYTGFDRMIRKFEAAAGSGIVTVAFTYPLDLVRTRLAVDVSRYNEPRQYQGTIGCIKKITKNEGIFALYKGFWIACAGIVPYLALSLGTYDTLKPYLFDSKMSSPQTALSTVVNYLGAGTLAGLTAQILTYPLDTVRRRMQLNGGHGLQKAYRNSFDCIKKITLTEGMRGFYRGILPNLVKIPPAAAIQFSMYDLFKQQIIEGKPGF